MLKKIRAIAVVGVAWAGVWALSGAALNAIRFVLDARQVGVERSIHNLWPWMGVGIEVGGKCGFVAGATFAIMLTILPPLTGSRISRRWSVGYGIASGFASSLYILSIGYGTMMVPFFAAVFGLTGALTALATTAIADGATVPEYREELAI